MRVQLLIGSLETGGSQVQMALLAEGLAGRGHSVVVTTLYPGGAVADRLAAGGVVEMRSLYRRKARNRPLVGVQLLRAPSILRRLWPERPDEIYYSMLDITNLMAAVALGPRRSKRLIWGIRGSGNRLSLLRRTARWFCARLSGRVGLLLSNSRAGLLHHEELGFRARSHEVLANGIDTDRFAPGSPGAADLRRVWGVPVDKILVGLVGRVVDVKDHPTFLGAAARLAGRRDDLRFVCVGGGKPKDVVDLQRKVADLDLQDRCLIVGEVEEMPDVYGAFDLLVLSSYGEGFPNALAEGMACGLPCVTTDVGDAGLIVREGDVVVPTRDVESLAAGIERRIEIGIDDREGQRHHIQTHFSTATMLDRTEEMLKQLASGIPGTEDRSGDGERTQ